MPNVRPRTLMVVVNLCRPRRRRAKSSCFFIICRRICQGATKKEPFSKQDDNLLIRVAFPPSLSVFDTLSVRIPLRPQKFSVCPQGVNFEGILYSNFSRLFQPFF